MTDVAPLASLLRRSGARVECDVAGGSMRETVPPGACVTISCTGTRDVRPGSVVAVMIGGELSVHRVVHLGKSSRARGWVVTHGDANLTCDAPVPEDSVVGLVVAWRAQAGTEWRPLDASVPPYRWITRTVQRVVCALLEIHPGLARRAKALVVLAMVPVVWLRPYPPGQPRTASLAHRTPA